MNRKSPSPKTQPVNSILPALHGVVEQAPDAVAIVLVVLRRVDAALGGNRVRAARRVLEAETADAVAEFRERRRRAGAGETGADHDHVVFPLVRRVHQLHLEAVLVPLLGERAGGDAGIDLEGHGRFNERSRA